MFMVNYINIYKNIDNHMLIYTHSFSCSICKFKITGGEIPFYCVPRGHLGLACLHFLKICSWHVTLKILLAFLAYNCKHWQSLTGQDRWFDFHFKKYFNRGKITGHAYNTGSKICLINYIMLSLWLEWINWDDNHGSDKSIF